MRTNSYNIVRESVLLTELNSVLTAPLLSSLIVPSGNLTTTDIRFLVLSKERR